MSNRRSASSVWLNLGCGHVGALVLILAAAAISASACDDDTAFQSVIDDAGLDGHDGVADAAAFDAPTGSDSGAETSSDATTACPPLKGSPPPATTCSKTFGLGIDRLLPSSIAIDRDGNIVVTGSFYGTVDFGGGAMTSAGDADGFLLKLDPQCNHLWSKRFGSTNVEGGVRVAVDDKGDVFLAAVAQGSVNLGQGELAASSDGLQDIVVAKFDACGAPAWTKRFGRTGGQAVRTLAVDPAGTSVVLGGDFYGSLDFGGGDLPTGTAGADAFLAKLDGAGKHLWSKAFGAASVSHSTLTGSVALESDGSIVASGLAQLTVDFGTGPIEFPQPSDGVGWWLVRFDSLGAAQIARAVNDASVALTRSPSGELYGLGGLSGPADLGTGPLTTDGGTSFPSTVLMHLQSASLSTDWLRAFGSNAPTRKLIGSAFAARSADIGMSASCSGAVDLGGPQPCADGEHVFARYGSDGGFLSLASIPRGPVAVAPTNQYVIAGARGTSAGAPERMTITKLAP